MEVAQEVELGEAKVLRRHTAKQVNERLPCSLRVLWARRLAGLILNIAGPVKPYKAINEPSYKYECASLFICRLIHIAEYMISSTMFVCSVRAC